MNMHVQAIKFAVDIPVTSLLLRFILPFALL